MNKTASIQGLGAEKETKEQLKQKINQYVEQQPESTRTFHKWMKRLEVASLVLIAAAFIVALYVSITWKSVNPTMIAIAWFIFAASASPTLVLVGIHSIVLRAFPAVVLPGKNQKFSTGSGAVWAGWGSILSGLALATLWGLFTYSAWTSNMAMLGTLISILGVALGVGMAISIVVGMALKTVQMISKSR
jgi:hypothetical protein